MDINDDMIGSTVMADVYKVESLPQQCTNSSSSG